ncbi:MAG TPA: PVC-type heme-binding CxxCH protein [Verrucomicrobiae bacterium]|nr:PVC-type heme-binding CxxCH protein [Verrucomicrobiae bacterium]
MKSSGSPTRGFKGRPLLALLLAAATAIQGTFGAEPAFKVAENFSITRVAGPPQIIYPMFAGLGDDGVLFVAESSGLDLYEELQKLTRRCRISRLEDRDGDGVFERSHVFADKLVFPMGLVWHQGALYAADPPDLIVLKDRDGDGLADERKVLLTGFGHSDNGSLHGLIFGPDGWLYMTLGQPDGYKLKRPDGTFLEGKSGALLRCRADGSSIELVARGFENLVEIDFMPTGEIIGTDNWFSMPEAGQRDALVHVVEGGVYPLNAHARTERHHFQSGPLLPHLAIYPAVALSGITRYRGTQFPSRFVDSLFTAQFNARKVVVHRLQRHDATFRSNDEDFVTTDDPDFHPSDVMEDIDGSVLVVDTGAWYVHHCPTGRIRKAPAQGGIYRVSFNQRDGKAPLRSRGERPPPAGKQTVHTPDKPDLAVLTSTNSEATAGAARAIGRRGDKTTEGPLLRLLSHSKAHVRLAAAEALVRCGTSNAIAVLTVAMAGEREPLLEHALIFTLFRLADRPTLVRLLEHPSPRVEQAALTLLDQAPHRSLDANVVVRRVVANDESLRRTALAILQKHPEWGAAAEPLIRQMMYRAELNNSERGTLRDLLLAFQNDPAVQTLIPSAMADANLPASRRVLVLEAIARSTIAPLPVGWVGVVEQALHSDDLDVCLQAVRTTELRRIDKLDAALKDLAIRTNVPAELRLTALRSVLPRQPQLQPAIYEFLLTQISRGSRPASRLAAAELLGRARWADSEKDPARLLAVVQGDRLISTSTLLPLLLQGRGAGFSAVLKYLSDSAERGWQPVEKELQMIRQRLSAEANEDFTRLTSKLAQRAAQKREQVETYMELLAGGDPERGRKWFSEKAGCIACHRTSGEGGILGPDLARVGAIRAGRDLLESIVLPSASFAQGYETFSVVLRSGEEMTGVRVRQDDNGFVLREASGREVRLDEDQVQSVERLQLSLMPEGLLAALSREETRDLLAYLQSLK